MRFLSLLLVLLPWPVLGISLHYGDAAIELGAQRVTRPALVVDRGGTLLFGAMYSDAAPAGALHANYGGTEYWIGAGCAPGTYSPDGISPCRACGIGHWCAGGKHRAACTGGAIACNGTNHSSDADAPAGAPINTLMTLEQVNEFIPVTNADQWQLLSICGNYPVVESTGTIGPGTYLFFSHYQTPNSAVISNSIDSITGNLSSISKAVIAVFDHPVSYESLHGNGIFQHFIDTKHPTYTEWDISTAPAGGWYTANSNDTNISNIINIDCLQGNFNLCVFELK